MLNSHNKWLPLGEVSYISRNELESRIRLDPSSEWFSGHFEGAPIVPGVLMLSLVVEMVRRQGKRERRNLEVSGFLKVRIKKIVFPGEEIRITVEAMPVESRADLKFELTCEGVQVAKGILRLTENTA